MDKVEYIIRKDKLEKRLEKEELKVQGKESKIRKRDNKFNLRQDEKIAKRSYHQREVVFD